MDSKSWTYDELVARYEQCSIRVHTLGDFLLIRDNEEVDEKEFGRDASLQLFQFLLTSKHFKALHKEQIIDRIWPEHDMKGGAQQFKVALHGVNKVLEPNRERGVDPKYVVRHGSTYHVELKDIWLDTEMFEEFIVIANESIQKDNEVAIKAYRSALELYEGKYLPNRVYEEWSADERERLQLMALGAMMSLADLMLPINPNESIRICGEALMMDNTWEEAYRIQMMAYEKNGNRPMVIKTYKACEKVLEEEFGIDPLPETRRILDAVKNL